MTNLNVYLMIVNINPSGKGTAHMMKNTDMSSHKTLCGLKLYLPKILRKHKSFMCSCGQTNNKNQ